MDVPAFVTFHVNINLYRNDLKMTRYKYLFLLPWLALCGCSDSSRPSDLPPLFPAVVTVTQDGIPFSGAYVELVSSEPSTYRASATTDERGIATLMTYGFPGAPAGKYKIIVRKSVDDDIVYGTDVYGEQTILALNRYSVIESRYGNAEQTPHEIEITSGSRRTQVMIDVGNAVRVRIGGSH